MSLSIIDDDDDKNKTDNHKRESWPYICCFGLKKKYGGKKTN